jgi:beta-glucanase (GH16 family)
MIERTLLAALGIAATLTLAAPPAAADAGPVPEKAGYLLVRNWDFGVNCNDLRCIASAFYTRYAYDNGRQDYLPGNGDWQRYRMNGNHEIEGGVLKLVARNVDGWRKGGFESGMIRSKLSQQYGYFEARLRVPKGRGLWTSFELLPADAVWPPSITVAAVVNNRPEASRTSYHLLSGPAVGPAVASRLDRWSGYTIPADLADGFHVFAVDWTPTTVVHYVDGEKVAEHPFRWVHEDGRGAGPAQLVISLAVGSEWAGPPMEASDFPAAVEVDYIRVYKRDPDAVMTVSEAPGR